MSSHGRPLDVVAYMSAVRAAGFCRPLSHTILLLEDAFDRYGEEVLSVAYTAITNLKYIDRPLRKMHGVDKGEGSIIRMHGVDKDVDKGVDKGEGSIISRAAAMLDWIVAKDITPSVQTMVRSIWYSKQGNM